MRLSELFTKTSKNSPADETAKNAQLLIKAGYIHKEMAGVYAYLPLGVKVIENIKKIIREEMNAIGGQEITMTVLQPKEIWEKTDRWDDKKVDNWFKTKLVNGTELGVGLTHEEPITDMLREFVNSYRDLPIYTYQIGNKYRNELRAKSGLMRGREFIMKDLYSFSRSVEEHNEFYERAVKAYLKVYERMGIGDITYRTYASGGIFTDFSDEFQTLSHVGEDTIYVNKEKQIAVNKEVYNDETLTKLSLKKEDLVEEKAVEVGNTFSLGSKYSDALDLYYTDESGKQQSIIMGCYGIGVSRLMGLLAEHFADDKGLVWPVNIAPFKAYLLSLNDNEKVIKEADELYNLLTENGIEVLYDDRDARSGTKFSDADLLGIPYRIVVSAKTLEKSGVEWKVRNEDSSEIIDRGSLLNRLQSAI